MHVDISHGMPSVLAHFLSSKQLSDLSFAARLAVHCFSLLRPVRLAVMTLICVLTLLLRAVPGRCFCANTRRNKLRATMQWDWVNCTISYSMGGTAVRHLSPSQQHKMRSCGLLAHAARGFSGTGRSSTAGSISLCAQSVSACGVCSMMLCGVQAGLAVPQMARETPHSPGILYLQIPVHHLGDGSRIAPPRW